jgi:hypothetical protein
MISRRLFAVAAALGFSLTAQVACAEDQYYEFKDDPLSAGGLDPNGAQLKVRKKPPITTLIRPRASFVPELLKSVEHI